MTDRRSGPDIPLGAGVLLGRVPAADYVRRHVPDAALAETMRARGVTDGKSLLMVGSLTDAQYRVRLRREPGLGIRVKLGRDQDGTRG